MQHAVIGLIGKKRVGKDTVAAQLVESHGFARLAFADVLKEVALDVDPFVQVADHYWRLSKLVELVGWEKAKAYPDVRRLLQRFGIRIRQVDPNFWLRPVDTALELRKTSVVITDVRFANEAELVRKYGGMLVRIERESVDDGDTHESESALPEIEADVLITNDGTVQDLLSKVPSLFSYSR